MRIRMLGAPAALSLSFLLTACGGGGGGDLADGSLAGGNAGGWAVVWSIPTSGEVQVNSVSVSADPFPLVAMSVGDDSINDSVRTLLQFDISNLNIGAADEVHLRVVTNPPAGDPFGELGGVRVDHILGEGGFVQEMHGGFTLQAGVAMLPVEQESYLIDVTAQVHADLLAGRSTSTFRFRTVVPTDLDESYDQWRMVSSSSVWPPSHPSLQITEYQ